MDSSLIPDAKELVNTNRLVSVDISRLMPLVVADHEHDAEDSVYLNDALQKVSEARDLHRKDDYAGALKAVGKAIKKVSELVAIRKPKNPDYAILEAPFYFVQGDILTSYIIDKADVFGNIP